jgi:hypothetical protein
MVWSNPNPNPNDTDHNQQEHKWSIVCQLGEKSNPQQCFNMNETLSLQRQRWRLRINDDSFHMHIIGEESSVMSDGHEEDLDDDKCRVSTSIKES